MGGDEKYVFWSQDLHNLLLTMKFFLDRLLWYVLRLTHANFEGMGSVWWGYSHESRFEGLGTWHKLGIPHCKTGNLSRCHCLNGCDDAWQNFALVREISEVFRTFNKCKEKKEKKRVNRMHNIPSLYTIWSNYEVLWKLQKFFSAFFALVRQW